MRLQIFLLVPPEFFPFKSVALASCIHACPALPFRSNTISE
jgi:hypothetical protein